MVKNWNKLEKKEVERRLKNKWFEIQDTTAYYEEFKKQKVSWQRVTGEPMFILVDENIYISDSMAFLISDKINYLLASLNSKLIYFYINKITHQYGNTGYLLSNQFVEQIPIPEIDEESQKPFIKLVDEILEAKQKIKDYKTLLDEAIKNNNFDREIALKKELENLESICITNEKTIDQMVYKLYDLTQDEINIIEKSN